MTYRVTQKVKNRYHLNDDYIVGLGAFVKEKQIRPDGLYFRDGWFMIV